MAEIDWRRYAEIAYVTFGWSPDQFWQATPVDFWCAYRGHQKMRGTAAGDHPLRRAEFDNLLKRTLPEGSRRDRLRA